MSTTFTRAYNDISITLTSGYTPGSGVLHVSSLDALPGDVPSSSKPLRLSVDRNRDGAKTILIATGRSGLTLTGCAVAEGKTDIPLDAYDVAKVRLSAGYINDLEDAVNALETAVLDTTGDGSAVLVTTTGASTARSLATRFADVKNVRDFGALGDGTTNDSTAIQAAITAAGSGTIFFPPGTYRCNIAVPANVALLGAGRAATTLKSVAGSNGDVIKGVNFGALTGKSKATGDYLLGCPGITISHMTIDGDKSHNATSGYGIRVWGCNSRLDSLIVQNCKNDGIWTEFTDSDGFSSPAESLEGFWANVKSIDNGGNGWTHRGPHDSVLLNYVAFGNGGWAFQSDIATGGYNGGISGAGWNSYLNGSGSYSFGSALGSLDSSTASGLTGIGIVLGSASGTCRFTNMLISGHTTGMVLAGSSHVFSGAIHDCATTAISVQGATNCSVDAVGSGNGNVLAFDVAENGPNVYRGTFNIPSGKTFSTGSASSISHIEIGTNGGNGNVDHTVVPSLTVGSLSGLLKATSGAVGTATAGTDYISPAASNTWTANNQTFGDGTGSGFNVLINAAASSIKALGFQSAGSFRWIIRCDNTTESGSNAGANFVLVSRNDNGTFLSSVLTIVRSTGAATFANTVTATSFSGSGSALTGITTSQLGGAPDGVLKGSSGSVVAAVAGTDYLSPAGDGSGLTNLSGANIAGNITNAAGLSIPRQNSGSGNGGTWGIGIQNSAANDNVQIGYSSTAYTTGGGLAWIGNSVGFLYYPGTFKIGHGTGSTAALVLDTSLNATFGGTVAATSFSGAGSSLTSLNASNISSGTVAAARLPVFVASGTSHAAGAVPDPGSSAGTTKYLREDATWAVPAGAGTVTSVDVSVPGVIFSVSGNPITTSGTIAFSLLTQSANTVFAGPSSGSAATPTFRSLATADLPGALYQPILTGKNLYYFTIPTGAVGTFTGSVGDNGNLRVHPFWVSKSITMLTLGAEVTATGESASKVRLGIWNDSGGYPGTVFLDAGQIAGNSATVQEISINSGSGVVLAPGLYWAGAVIQGVTTSAPNLRTVSGGPSFIPATALPTAGQVPAGYIMNSVTGSLATFTATPAVTSNAIRMFYKVQ